MGGATILCGTFEGSDKSGSPIVSVLEEAFHQTFGRKPRGRIGRRLAKLIGRDASTEEDLAERSILDVKYNEDGQVSPTVARRLLPCLQAYQVTLLQRLGIADDVEEIWPHVSGSVSAKYGSSPDPGWHLYCLHDLVPACRKSAAEDIPVQVIW